MRPSQRAGFRLAIALALLAWCCLARPLDLDRRIDQFHHTGWTAANGAPSQIGSITQTSDGYLWLGSTQGLYRFDGFEFERFTPVNDVKLPSFNIYAIEPDPAGGLWVSFRPSGIGFVKNGRLDVFNQPGEAPPSQAYVLRMAEGELLAGTHKGLYARRGTQWLQVGMGHGLPADRVHSLISSAQGLIAAVGDAVYFRPKGKDDFRRIIGSAIPIYDLRLAPDGDLWLSNETGCIRIHDWATEQPRSSAWPIYGRFPPTAVLPDRDGAVWLADDGDITRIRGASSRAPANSPPLVDRMPARALASGRIHRIFEDRDGNVWTTGARGLDRFRSNPVVPLPLQSWTEDGSGTLAVGREGEVWLASATSEMRPLRIDKAAREGRSPRMGLGDGPVFGYSVYRDGDGTLWWAGRGVIYRQQGAAVQEIVGLPAIRQRAFWEVTRAPSQPGLWVGVDEDGLWQYHEGRWQRAQLPAGMLERGPSASLDAGEESWFGYTGNRVRVVANGRAVAYGEADGLDVGRIKVIRGQGGHKWLGGELGLSVFHHGRFHRVRLRGAEQLGAVGGIIEAKDGDVWLAEMRSLVRITHQEVERLLLNPAHSVTATRYTSADGLPGGPQMNSTGSTAVEATDGTLWFVTDTGLAWVDPSRIGPPPAAPNASAAAILADGEKYTVDGLSKPLQLPLGLREFEIAYMAPQITIPERMRFRYRLAGYDADWRDAGDRRKAAYAKVPPGRYAFEVQAAMEGGEWSAGGKPVDIDIPPFYWENGWFKRLGALAAMGLLALIYFLRLRGVRHEMARAMQHRHEERERIARDLHDTLLQSTQGLMLSVQALADRTPDGHPDRARIERALELADRAVYEGRRKVLELRAGDAESDLADLLGDLAAELHERGPAAVVMRVEGGPRPLVASARSEALRIGQEAVLNAHRHARAQHIEVTLAFNADALVLRVSDDGTGMSAALMDGSQVRPGHFGLAGLRERAATLGAALAIRGGVAGGTVVELRVPAGLAYSAG